METIKKELQFERALVAVFYLEMEKQIGAGRWKSQRQFLMESFPDTEGINSYFIQLVRGRGSGSVPKLTIEKAEELASALGVDLVMCILEARKMLMDKTFPYESVAMDKPIADNVVGRPPK